MKYLSNIKIFGFGLLFLFSGCSIFNTPAERPVFKSDTENSKTLAIPDDLSSAKMKDFYPMPQPEKPFIESEMISISPPGSGVKS